MCSANHFGETTCGITRCTPRILLHRRQLFARSGVISRHMTDAIALRDVTKTFDGVTAVNALTLTVPRGSVYGFIGPNGSGKTTTIRMIMNILLPDRGEIELLGEQSTRAARDRVSYLPEERGLYKKMTLRRLLRYYGRLKGMPLAKVDAAADRWLKRL